MTEKTKQATLSPTDFFAVLQGLTVDKLATANEVVRTVENFERNPETTLAALLGVSAKK